MVQGYAQQNSEIVEVKVEGLPASAQEEQKQEIPSQEPSSTVTFRHLYSFCIQLFPNGCFLNQ